MATYTDSQRIAAGQEIDRQFQALMGRTISAQEAQTIYNVWAREAASGSTSVAAIAEQRIKPIAAQYASTPYYKQLHPPQQVTQPTPTAPPAASDQPPLTSNPGQTALWNNILEANPWLRTLGISAARLKELTATSSGSAELMNKLMEEDVVKRRTQAMRKSDGTRRFSTVAELFNWENQVRGVLRQAGINVDREYASPQTLIGFAESDLSPDELRDRLAVWKGVKDTGQRAREIFYVYSGLNVSDDDLYEALVDRGKGQQLADTVNAAVGETLSGPNAWAEWIDRARQAGQARITKVFEEARQSGATYASTIQRVMNIDPAFANQIMDSLYSGGDPGGGDFLDLTALLDAYEFMAIGAAAEGAGLDLPTKERLAEIRAAGVQRSQAIDAYQQFGLNRDKLNAAVLRARGDTFTQTDFEQGQFFGDAEARKELEHAEAYMTSAGRSQGVFAFGRGERGQFVQTGFSAR